MARERERWSWRKVFGNATCAVTQQTLIEHQMCAWPCADAEGTFRLKPVLKQLVVYSGR